MSTRIVSLSAAVAAACLLAAPGWALAHGGFGGIHIGGGHFGGGHFGGGHFGGGHFGGGHHFGGGGWGGGHFHGGNVGGGNFGGGSFRGGGMGSGGMVGGATRAGSNFGQSKLGGVVRSHMSGGSNLLSGRGSGGALQTQRLAGGTNSFVTRHVSGFSSARHGGTQVASSGQKGTFHAGHHGGGAGTSAGTGTGTGTGSTGSTGSGSDPWGLGQFGYPRGALAWGIVSSILNNIPFGYGYGGYGYGGYGYGGYGYGGYGYGGGYGYNPNCYYGNTGLGGYASPGYYLYTVAGNTVAAASPVVAGVVTADATAVAQQPATGVNSTAPSNAIAYADQAEAAFKAGDFKGAEYALRHAVVDDPSNAVLVMMLSQSLFANGKYDEAAGAAQNAMQQLPKDQWGVVVSNYKDLYNGNQAFTDQLRALEKAAKEKSDSPAVQFLLGFQYGYLGYPKDAVERLDNTLKLAPRDEIAKQLREEMRAKLPKSAAGDAGK